MIPEQFKNQDIPIEVRISDDSKVNFNVNYTFDIWLEYLKHASLKRTNYYGMTDNWLYQAFERYPIKGHKVLLVGSANPWYEAVVLKSGAIKVDCVEYADRPRLDSQVEYIKPGKIKDTYDSIVNISSVEHDGLGRYGDPIDYDADLKTMLELKSYVKPNGLHYLAVPVGPDKIIFNLHRIYGPKRLPMLLSPWALVDHFGFDGNSWTNTENGINGTPYQPVFVLQKQ